MELSPCFHIPHLPPRNPFRPLKPCVTVSGPPSRPTQRCLRGLHLPCFVRSPWCHRSLPVLKALFPLGSGVPASLRLPPGSPLFLLTPEHWQPPAPSWGRPSAPRIPPVLRTRPLAPLSTAPVCPGLFLGICKAAWTECSQITGGPPPTSLFLLPRCPARPPPMSPPGAHLWSSGENPARITCGPSASPAPCSGSCPRSSPLHGSCSPRPLASHCPAEATASFPEALPVLLWPQVLPQGPPGLPRLSTGGLGHFA